MISKAFVFDFDDTLATTDCIVNVRRPNRRFPVRRLSPAEFNTDVLGEDEWYDFSEFRSAGFIRSANPTFLIHLAKEVYDSGFAVYVLTARADNVANAIADWLCGFGVKPVKVHAVGSDDSKVNIAEEKQKVLQTIKELFDVVYFYDDDQHNVDLADQVGVKTYLI